MDTNNATAPPPKPISTASTVGLGCLAVLILPAILFGLLLVDTATDAPPSPAAQKAISGAVRVRMDGEAHYNGFRAFSDLLRYTALENQGDFAAKYRFVNSGALKAGVDFMVWERGEQLFVAERRPYAVCLRQPRYPDCFWAAENILATQETN